MAVLPAMLVELPLVPSELAPALPGLIPALPGLVPALAPAPVDVPPPDPCAALGVESLQPSASAAAAAAKVHPEYLILAMLTPTAPDLEGLTAAANRLA